MSDLHSKEGMFESIGRVIDCFWQFNFNTIIDMFHEVSDTQDIDFTLRG